MEGSTLRELAIRVSQYFLDFLESDFKRQQAPRRRLTLQTDAGFRAGMKVAPYPALQKKAWHVLTSLSGEGTHFTFRSGAFTRPMSATLTSVVRQHIEALPESALTAVRSSVVQQARETRGAALKNPETWVDQRRAHVASELSTQVIHPLLALLDGPLTQQAYSAADSLFAAEIELVERVAADLDAALPGALSALIATGDEAPLQAACDTLLTLDGVQAALSTHFDAYATADAFLEFRDLDQYVSTSEGMQVYLYLGAIKYAGMTFPVFFLPVDIERLVDGRGYEVSLRPHLYANKRAIDFVLQELGARQQRAWTNPIRERITYLDPGQSVLAAAAPMFRELATAFDLAGQLELTPDREDRAATADLTLSTALHFAAFDSADEALLNDYEEMIEQARLNKDGVIGLFERIVQGVLTENPVSAHRDIDGGWDALPFVDRLVADTPIPLNEEQRKVLAALNRPDCQFILVEGPPGTGKSHTITAIAADCALKKRSCLILSDKKEALDVVQQKLSDAMNAVRHDKKFPNPILRLGQDSANFRSLTSNQTLAQVTAYAKASNAHATQVAAELTDKRDVLKQQIQQTVTALGGVALRDVADLYRLEATLGQTVAGLAAALERAVLPELSAEVRRLDRTDGSLETYLRHLFATGAAGSTRTLRAQVRVDTAAAALAGEANARAMALLDSIDTEQLRRLQSTLLAFDQLRMPVFGHLFRGTQVRALEAMLNSTLRSSAPLLLRRDASVLRLLAATGERIRRALPDYGCAVADLPVVYRAIAKGRTFPVAATWGTVLTLLSERSDPDLDALFVGGTAGTGNDWAQRWLLALEYLAIWSGLHDRFAGAPQMDYVGSKTQLEQLNTTVMNAEVDNRLVGFMNDHRADARTLASLITQRQKFPEEKFGDVKESFPIIIASIREFGEYMPLRAGLFDVLVIDEASQVSVAQAFPALLRAKQVVVLGDSKQFSNTKSSNASIALNDKHRADLVQYFKREVSAQAEALHRLSRFDVKCSVLEFVELCANYNVMLKKHFRSYKELISFSSQTFYNGQLQAIKIRGCPLDEVIQFSEVNPAGHRATRGTNPAEAEFILERLLELVDAEEPPTVGVITPFREQQTLLTRVLFGHARGAEFQDKLRLKVMTCDSCQGEERQLIFYSLVATKEHDALNYVFPVHLEQAQEHVEEKLKVQRLNVAFSRAQEMIWFVLSKPTSEYHGAIAKVLHHYQGILESGDGASRQTDPNSPMEAKLLGWLTETPFYQRAADQIEIVPQFPIGDYLRQLDPTYQHQAYRVDFLMTVSAPAGRVHVIIEYDGFEHHFQRGHDIHVGNHERYLREEDVERQLILESYGYRFLRVNRFNLGLDPVATLSDRLTRLVAQTLQSPGVDTLEILQAQAEGLTKKELKPCSRCGAIKPHDQFYDPHLGGGNGGHGRVCLECKTAERTVAAQKAPRATQWHHRKRWGRRY